jgi:hypothetical protein
MRCATPSGWRRQAAKSTDAEGKDKDIIDGASAFEDPSKRLLLFTVRRCLHLTRYASFFPRPNVVTLVYFQCYISPSLPKHLKSNEQFPSHFRRIHRPFRSQRPPSVTRAKRKTGYPWSIIPYTRTHNHPCPPPPYCRAQSRTHRGSPPRDASMPLPRTTSRASWPSSSCSSFCLRAAPRRIF